MLLPYATINYPLINIFNIRNFKYFSEFKYEQRFYNKSFDLKKIKKVYYVAVPFSSIRGVAHTLLSFEFEGNDFLAISIEIRKKEKDEYSPIKGLFKQYEIMYVVGDENDLIKQRSNYRKNSVYMYPLKLEKNQVKELFLDMIKKVNLLNDSPEFYNTLTNACAINIAKHANKVLNKKIPFHINMLMPEYSDKLIYELGLIDTDLNFNKAREHFLVNKLAENATEENFSLKIRGRIQ